jgi:hypothetical protein
VSRESADAGDEVLCDITNQPCDAANPDDTDLDANAVPVLDVSAEGVTGWRVYVDTGRPDLTTEKERTCPSISPLT